jgi:hypothetical protein
MADAMIIFVILPVVKRGALTNRAEIIPNEPDTDNAVGGSS